MRERSAARRYQSVHAAQTSGRSLRHLLALKARRVSSGTRARLAAHRCGDFAPWDRASCTRADRSSRPLSGGFRLLRPAQSSHRRQPHIVGADGYPRRPGFVFAKHKRRRRILSRHHNASRRRPQADRTVRMISAPERAGISSHSNVMKFIGGLPLTTLSFRGAGESPRTRNPYSRSVIMDSGSGPSRSALADLDLLICRSRVNSRSVGSPGMTKEIVSPALTSRPFGNQKGARKAPVRTASIAGGLATPGGAPPYEYGNFIAHPISLSPFPCADIRAVPRRVKP